MTATDKLNSAARSMGWANWAEVISHNAPPHVINAVVMRAMDTKENTNREPATGKPKIEDFYDTSNPTGISICEFNEYMSALMEWEKANPEPALTCPSCGSSDRYVKFYNADMICHGCGYDLSVSESDAVVVG